MLAAGRPALQRDGDDIIGACSVTGSTQANSWPRPCMPTWRVRPWFSGSPEGA